MMKTCAMLISKADCIARDKILFSKLLDVSEVFETLCTQSRLMKNKGRNIKGGCYHISRKQQFYSRGQITKYKLPAKKPLTPIINGDNADGHSQTPGVAIDKNRYRFINR